MSEYQYYDFCTIDRPLTSSQRAELAKISTRVSRRGQRASTAVATAVDRVQHCSKVEAPGVEHRSGDVAGECWSEVESSCGPEIGRLR
jgi:hypothetical protein